MYGAIKSDHINYSLLSSVELPSNEVIASDDRNSDEQNRVVLPSFKHMITYVCDMVQKRSSNSSTKKFAYGQVIIPFSYEVYQEVSTLSIHNFFPFRLFFLIVNLSRQVSGIFTIMFVDGCWY